MAENEVWGFTIEKSPAGKNIWPNEVKWEATRRIREDGQSPGDVAAELGAHECLVRKCGLSASDPLAAWLVLTEPWVERILRAFRMIAGADFS